MSAKRTKTARVLSQSGEILLGGTTGGHLMLMLERQGFRPLPNQPVAMAETRLEPPAGLPEGVGFYSITPPLRELMGYRSNAGELSERAKRLPDAFFTENLEAGGGHKPGRVAAALDYKAGELRRFLDDMGEQCRSISPEGIRDSGFAPVRLALFSPAGASGNAFAERLLEHASLTGDPTEIYFFTPSPYVGHSSTDYEVEGAAAAASLLAMQRYFLRQDYRPNLRLFMYPGRAFERGTVLEDMARDVACLMQSICLEEVRADAVDHYNYTVRAARRLPGGRVEPSRFLNIVHSVTLRVPVEEWWEYWISRLCRKALKYVLSPDEGRSAGPPDPRARPSEEAERIIARMVSGGENRPEQVAQSKLREAGGEEKAAFEKWRGECLARVQKQHAALVEFFRKRARKSADSHPPHARKEVLLKESAFLKAVTEAVASAQAESLKGLQSGEKAVLSRDAKDGPNSSRARQARLEVLYHAVRKEVCEALEAPLSDAVARIGEDAEAADALLERLQSFERDLELRAEQAEDRYELAKKRSGQHVALRLDDDRYGPGFNRFDNPLPMEQRELPPVKRIARALLALTGEELLRIDVEQLTELLVKAAAELLPPPPTVWELLKQQPELLEKAVRRVRRPPTFLNEGRLAAYGNQSVGHYMMVDESFHEALQQNFPTLRVMRPLDNADRYALRLKAVHYGVPLMALKEFPAWVESYLRIREQDGMPLHAPAPWDEEEMLKAWDALRRFDAAMGSPAYNERPMTVSPFVPDGAGQAETTPNGAVAQEGDHDGRCELPTDHLGDDDHLGGIPGVQHRRGLPFSGDGPDPDRREAMPFGDTLVDDVYGDDQEDEDEGMEGVLGGDPGWVE